MRTKIVLMKLANHGKLYSFLLLKPLKDCQINYRYI